MKLTPGKGTKKPQKTKMDFILPLISK
jgi:hypothetical protein